LKDKPAQTYSYDKSGMPLQHKMPKIITTKETKRFVRRSAYVLKSAEIIVLSEKMIEEMKRIKQKREK